MQPLRLGRHGGHGQELACRGLSELLMNVARSTQNTAWELWMKMAFNPTQDPRVLEEFLEVSSRSISGVHRQQHACGDPDHPRRKERPGP